MKPAAIILLVFSLSLLMIWKANKVKEYYGESKKLEKAKKSLISENSELRAYLMDLKSLSAVGKIVTRRGLTQKVSGRIRVLDPAPPIKFEDRRNFVDVDAVADAIEDAVFRSGRVTAEEGKNPPNPK